ncbi:hypothetical protein V8E36_001376 [Tilletia maclaganii]
MRDVGNVPESGPEPGAPSALSVANASAQSKDAENNAPASNDVPEVLPGYSPMAAPGMQLSDGATPAGLKNIGNTCYLNSVLQYFFTIKDVRDQVMQAAAVIQRNPQSWKAGELRVGGRLVSPSEIERSRKFVVQLSNLFDNMITSPAAAVEPERELAYLALVSSRTEEAVLSTKTPDNKLAGPLGPMTEGAAPSAPNPDAMQTDTQVTAEPLPAADSSTGQSAPLQPIEQDQATPAASQEPTTATSALAALPGPSAEASGSEIQRIEPQAQESLMQLGAQQDVGECLDNVVFQIEVGLRSAGAQPGPLSESQEQVKSESAEAAASLNSAIERLFVGISSQRVVSLAPSSDAKPSEPKREIFTLIPIDITHEGCDVYDGLDNYFDDEEVEGSNVRRTVTLQEPPAILQIQAQRVQYDRQQGKLFKALTHLDVGEFLSLDRYLELPADHPGKADHDQRRAENAKLRKAEGDLAKKKAALFNGKTPVSDTLRHLSSTLRVLGSKPEDSNLNAEELDALKDVLELQAGEVQADIEKYEKDIAGLKEWREKIWKAHAETVYELVAVFMHRGEATHGHYFLNQRRLPDAPDGQARWLKYNDEQVCDVTTQEVFKDSTGATPYLLIYVRRKPEPTATIDTVRRHVAGVSAGPSQSATDSRPHPTPEPVAPGAEVTPGPPFTADASTQAADGSVETTAAARAPQADGEPAVDTIMEDKAAEEHGAQDTASHAPQAGASQGSVAMETE